MRTFLGLVATMAATTLFGAPKIWQPPFYNGVAAQVEKTLITYDDLRREMAQVSGQIRDHSKDADEYEAKMTEVYNQTLQKMIERALLVSEFNAKGYKIPQKDVDAEFQRVLKENFGGKLSDMISALQYQGLTISSYRKKLEEILQVSALQGRFRQSLPDITPDQIARYYNDNVARYAHDGSIKLSVITLKSVTDEPVEVLTQTAEEIRQKAEKGEDFQRLIEEYNDDEESNANWDWLKNSELAPQLSGAVKDLKVGEISMPVVLDDESVLIVKVVDRKNEGLTSLSDVREEIKKTLFEEQANTAYNKWIEQLKKKYFVKINE